MNIEQHHDNATEDEISFYLGLQWELLNVLAVLSIVANIYVSFVIVKYEELRKDVTNILLLHINMVEIFLLFSVTISTRIFMMLGLDITSTVPCVTYEVETAIVLCIFLLLILSTTNWYIKTYTKKYYHKFRRSYNLFVAAIYVLTIVVAYFTSQSHYCYSANNNRFYHAAIIFSFVMIVFVIVMNVIHRVKKRRMTDRVPDNIGLAITNIFMMNTTPFYFATLFAFFDEEPLEMYEWANCLATPIFSLIYLYQCDTYRAFLKRAFRCQCKERRNETVQDLPVAYNNANGVLITEQTHAA